MVVKRVICSAIRAVLGGVMLTVAGSLSARAGDCLAATDPGKTYYFAPEGRRHLHLTDTLLSDDARDWLKARPRDTEYHDLNDAGQNAGKTIPGSLKPHRPGVHNNPFFIVQGSLDLSGIVVCGSLTLKNMVVEGDLILRNARVGRDLVIDDILVRGDLDLSGADIGGGTRFAALTVRRDVFLARTVKDEATGEGRLLAMAPRGGLRAEQLTIGGDFSASGLRPGGDVHLLGITTGAASGSDGQLDLSCWDTSARLISLNVERVVVAGQFTVGAHSCHGDSPATVRFGDLLISNAEFNGPDRTQFQRLAVGTVQLFSNTYHSAYVRFDEVDVSESFAARGENYLGKDIRFQNGSLPSADFERARFGSDQTADVRFVAMTMTGVVNFKNVEVAGKLTLDGGMWGLIDARSMQPPAGAAGPLSAHLILRDVTTSGLDLENSTLGALQVSGMVGVGPPCVAGTEVVLDLHGSTVGALALHEGTFEGLVNLSRLAVPAAGFTLAWDKLANTVIAGDTTVGTCGQRPALLLTGNADHSETVAAYRLLEAALEETGTREDRNKMMYVRKCMADEGAFACRADPPALLSLVPAGCFSARWLDCINGYGLAPLRPVIWTVVLTVLFRLVIGWGRAPWSLQAGSGARAGFISPSIPVEAPGAPGTTPAPPGDVRHRLTDFAVRAVTSVNLNDAILLTPRARRWRVTVAGLRVAALLLLVALVDVVLTVAPDFYQRVTETKGVIP